MNNKKKYKKLKKQLKQEIRQTKCLQNDLQETIQELNDKKIEYQILIKQLKVLRKNLT